MTLQTDEERSVTAGDGVRLRARIDPAFERSGHRTLLLINSLGCELTMWDPQVAPWRATHDVLRYDQRGHGCSDAPRGPYDLVRLGRDATAVLDAFGVDQADVCGLSLGGLVAQQLCLDAPTRVRRVILADTAARIGTRDGWLERAELVRAEGMAAVTEPVLGRFFSPTALRDGGPAVASIRASLAGMDPDGYASSCAVLAAADLRGLLDGVPHAGLVIVGTADEATPPADARELADALPSADYAELDGAGHLANLERPAAFADLVADFLADSSSPVHAEPAR